MFTKVGSENRALFGCIKNVNSIFTDFVLNDVMGYMDWHRLLAGFPIEGNEPLSKKLFILESCRP